MDLKTIRVEGVDWINLDRERAHWRALADTTMTLRFI